MNPRYSTEKGQVLIFLVLGFVVFLGFVALAIDGGMVYSDRRHAQNGSDAASLAGGGAAAAIIRSRRVTFENWNCASNADLIAAWQAAYPAAINRAADNNFTITVNDPANGVAVTCVTGDYSQGFEDKYLDIRVDVSTSTETSFARLFYPSGLGSHVFATTRVRPYAPYAYGYAIVALNEDPCSGNSNGAIFGGDSEVSIHGGGVWSNGCLRGNGNSFSTIVDPPDGIAYAGDPSGNMDGFDPAPVDTNQTMPPNAWQVPAPNCAHPDAHHVSDLTLQNGTMELEEGLWCVSGQVRINGGEFTGEGVTIYLTGNGEITINGAADVNLSAPGYDPDPSPALPGVLFYVPNGSVDMEGNNDSFFLGMVYAPNGEIKAHGTSGTNPTFHTQLIGLNVDVSGTADIEINFDDDEQAQKPSYIELAR